MLALHRETGKLYEVEKGDFITIKGRKFLICRPLEDIAGHNGFGEKNKKRYAEPRKHFRLRKVKDYYQQQGEQNK